MNGRSGVRWPVAKVPPRMPLPERWRGRSLDPTRVGRARLVYWRSLGRKGGPGKVQGLAFLRTTVRCISPMQTVSVKIKNFAAKSDHGKDYPFFLLTSAA